MERFGFRNWRRACGQFLGSIRIGDVLRPEARDAVSSLKSMGLRTILLTGDARNVAESAARALGVDEVGAEMLPSQKVARVRELMKEGRTVVMVGDGINDAPALMQASVGVAMGSGTDVARESASVVLIGNDLSKFVDTLRIARKCRRIILSELHRHADRGCHWNRPGGIWLSQSPVAAFIHVTSELAFILNSTRLIPAHRVAPLYSPTVPSDRQAVSVGFRNAACLRGTRCSITDARETFGARPLAQVNGFARMKAGVGLQRRCWCEDLLNQYWISGSPCQTARVHGPLRISVRRGKA